MKNLRFYRVKDANEYINQLEAQLATKGLKPSAAPATSKTAAPAPKVAAATPAPVAVATPPAKKLQDYIDESNKAKPAAIEQAIKLTGMDAVRSSIRADIEKQRVKFELPVRRMSAPAATVSRPTRKQCEAIYTLVQPAAGPMPSSWSDDEVFVEMERAAFQSYQRIPGMSTDAELEGEYWRTSKPSGMRLYMQAEERRRIEQILKTK